MINFLKQHALFEDLIFSLHEQIFEHILKPSKHLQIALKIK